MRDRDTTCEWALDRIEAYLDDDLDAPERARLEDHLAACAPCARELALAARVREGLRALPFFEAPAHVVEAAERAALGAGTAPGADVVVLPARRRVLRGWPAAAAAVVVLVAAGLWLGGRGRGDGRGEELARAGVTEAEVEAAGVEIAIAFGYVGKYSDRAARIVRDDVLEERVLPRLEHAFSASRAAAIDDALVPGLRRGVREAGLDVTSPPPDRS
jgi:anti-sigma factor (TIGR02949 family)